MSEGLSKLDAVRLAKERLGEASAREIAAFIEANHGIRLQPAIVTVLLASLLEKEVLEQSKRIAHDRIEQARAEQASQKKPRRNRASQAPG